VARFVDGLEQGKEFIDQNPTEARRVLQEYTGMPAPVAAVVPLPRYDFDIRTEDLATWVRVLREIGQFDGQVDPTKLVLSSSK
jgi:ABC-type nitrate/sulfonate/bicarbonate transport system substrate-binding protein